MPITLFAPVELRDVLTIHDFKEYACRMQYPHAIVAEFCKGCMENIL